jgi:hypothetical protein
MVSCARADEQTKHHLHTICGPTTTVEDLSTGSYFLIQVSSFIVAIAGVIVPNVAIILLGLDSRR